MGKGIIIALSAFIIIMLVVILSVMGYIDIGLNIFQSDDPADPDNVNATGTFHDLGLTDRELHQAISLLANSTPPFDLHQNFINGLHMKSYGVNGVTAYSVLQDYEEAYADDGFISYDSSVAHGTGWTAFTEIWYNDDGMGRAIIVADGSSIHSVYGYDTTLITSYGPILDYYDYVVFLRSY